MQAYSRIRTLITAALVLLVCASGARLAAVVNSAGDWLKVSANRRYLVHADGSPFFYLGDTAWSLFQRLDRAQAERYLTDRASKGFTVVQAVALAELDGLGDANPYGHLPLIDNDPTRPEVRDGPDNDYWDHVDFIVDRAAQLGLRIGFLPTWGDKWMKAKWGVGPEIFTPENARAYGEWLGRRYRDRPSIIWILGGDRPIQNETHAAIIRAMAAGLEAGDGGAHLMTFHPPGQNGSSTWFHQDEWLDFNLRQNGHVVTYGAYARTLEDYRREPVKPVIDGEPVYEAHPVAFNQREFGHTIAADVRRPLYWDLFNGACGHTYGHHSIWQMYQPGKAPVNDPLMTWDEALSAEGAGQMQFARWLLESRPFLERIPDPSLVVEEKPATAWPGAGMYRFVGTRDEAGTYAMIYVPVGRRFTVKLATLTGTTLRAWWYDPRNGDARAIGEFEKTATKTFMPPDPGEYRDWVLVLDDAAKNYPPPGRRN